MRYTITSANGSKVSPLGLAAHPEQGRHCVRTAFDHGINYFFFYGPGNKRFIQELAPIVRSHGEEAIVATGSGARKRTGLLNVRRKILTALKAETIDVFFAEYVTGAGDSLAVFAEGGVLDQLQQWKSDGWIRFVGATTHDRQVAQQLAEDSRVDVLMHRLNMAHRKAIREVFPTAVRTHTPVVAFTATRWGTLLEPHDGWPGDPPSAADCYRYCLAHPAVHLVLTAPRTLLELKENLTVLDAPRMNARVRAKWERFGDLIYGKGTSAFETKWP